MQKVPQTQPLDDLIEYETLQLPWQLTLVQMQSVLDGLLKTKVDLLSSPAMSAVTEFKSLLQSQLRSNAFTIQQLRQAVLEQTQQNDNNDVQPLFERALFVFGIRRSGNHAIAEWFKGLFDEDVLYLNSAVIDFFKTVGIVFCEDRSDFL